MKTVDPDRWRQLILAATKADPPCDYWERWLAMHSEPHRHYHNHRHIAVCLKEFDSARELAADPVAVELAIWFHDAAYDPKAGDNEERSAELARVWLTELGAPISLANSVADLVLTTKTHDASLSVDAALLVDVDLSILGQIPARFWEYERQIREEYSWVPGGIYAIKRSEILEAFLKRPRIYTHSLFFERLESQARANLEASIQRLRDGRS